LCTHFTGWRAAPKQIVAAFRVYWRALALAAALAVGQNAVAQDAEEEKEEGWTGKGEFGFIQTSGNTDTSALNLALDFTYEVEKWRHSLGATALRSEKDDVVDAERYTFGAQSDYKLNDRSYIFGAFRYDTDKFAAYDPVSSLTAGYGYTLIDSGIHYLLGEIGAGYRTQEVALTGASEDEAIARGRLDYRWAISDSTEFANLFLIEAGSDNTYLQNDTSISVAINARFAIKAAFQWRHNTELPVGATDDTDTQFTTNLVYNF
jgi:putative salt-induced outer membrane protein